MSALGAENNAGNGAAPPPGVKPKKSDPTNAERQRRFKARRKQQQQSAADASPPPAPDEAQPVVTEPQSGVSHPGAEVPGNGNATALVREREVVEQGNAVPAERDNAVPAASERPRWQILPPPQRRKPDVITLTIALASACVSAGFSIVALTSVFGGAFWPVIALGVVLELGKLRAVALLGMGRGSPCPRRPGRHPDGAQCRRRLWIPS